LQRQGKVYRDGGCAATAFGVDHKEYFAAGTFFVNPALRGGQANESFEKIGGGSGALDVLASPGAHGIDDYLRLVEAADGEYS
jgi:hypothetical protein